MSDPFRHCTPAAYAPPARSTHLRPLGLVLILLAGFASLFAVAASHGHAEDAPATDNLQVGALLSLTGPSSTLGLTSQAALQLAAANINGQPGMPHVTLTVDDTKLDPNTALTDLQQMHAAGIRVVIGPQTSSELAAIKDYANANGMIIISQGSTSSALSVPNDNIFRVVPDDVVETQAMAALLQADGITTIVPVWRDDLGNQGLVDSLTTAFTADGGTMTAGVKYATDTTDFGSVADKIEAQLTAAQQTPGAKVGIYVAAFSEVTGLLDAASTRPDLGSVEWYGSDGVALISQLISDPIAAAFAQKVTYPNPTVGLDRSDAAEALWQPVADAIEQSTGMTPDTFGLAAYDALELAAKAASQATPDDTAGYIAALVAAADSSSGITGPLTFNANGDRATSPFDFWQVCQVSGAPQWVLGATYLPKKDGPGTVTRTAGCTPQPVCDGQAISLSGQWNLIAWPGPDGETVGDALSGADGCRNDVTSDVSVVWSYDSTDQTWQGYFLSAANIPGANDLQTLTAGAGYFIGLASAPASPIAW